MKCFLVLLAVVAVSQSRVLETPAGDDIVLHGAYGKEIVISKPYGPYAHRYIEIKGNGYFPDKKIDISDVSYPYGDETGYQRGKRSSDLFAEIFSGYTGTFDVEMYKKLLKKVEKAVEKGEINNYVYDLLLNYDLFAPYGEEHQFETGYPHETKFAGKYGVTGYPYEKFYGKHFGSEYPEYYNQYPYGFNYYKSSPFFWQYLAGYGKNYGYGKQFPFNYESQFYGPYNRFAKQYVPYKYDSDYVPHKYEAEYTVPHKYEGEAAFPRKFEGETVFPHKFEGESFYPHKYEAGSLYPHKYQAASFYPHKYESGSLYPHKYETESFVPHKYEGQFAGPLSYEGKHYFPYQYGSQYYGKQYGKQYFGHEGKVPQVGSGIYHGEYEGQYNTPFYGKYF